jgi:hypothetical protein
MPDKFLRDPKEIVKTYSRLMKHAYPTLPFDDYKLTIACFAIELTLARKASNAVYDITDLCQHDVAAMARLEAVPLCNYTTFFLHAVHLSLMKFICGEYGSTERLYERLQEEWNEVPMSSNRQLIQYLHSEDGGIGYIGFDVDIDDDEFSLISDDESVEQPYFGSDDESVEQPSIGTEESAPFENPNTLTYEFKTEWNDEITSYPIVSRIIDVSRRVWEQGAPEELPVPNSIDTVDAMDVQVISEEEQM